MRRRCRDAATLVLAGIACGGSPAVPAATDDGATNGTGSAATSTDGSSEDGGSDADDTGAPDLGAPDVGADPDDDGLPTPEQWQRLLALRYPEGPPPVDVTNLWADDAAAAALGQALFFDTRFAGPLLDGDNDGSPGTLGSDGDVHRVACASCHVPADGFVDTRSPQGQISLAAGWVLRRTPTLLDIGWASLLTWSGRRDAMHNVSFGAIENSREFNSSRLYYAKQLHANHRDAYEAVFGAMPDFSDTARFGTLSAEQAGCPEIDAPPEACQGRPGDGGVFDGLAPDDREAVTRAVAQASKAMGAYLRRLRCGPSRFDAWLDGDDAALTAAERRGAILFVSDAACDGCHAGGLLTDFAFHNVGLAPQIVATVFIDIGDAGASEGLAAALLDPLNSKGVYSDGDDGRLPARVVPELAGAFKTPGLRCIATQPAFMHTAQMDALEDVVAFFAAGGHPAGYPGTSELQALDLDDGEQADLVAFLRALTGPGPEAALLVPP